MILADFSVPSTPVQETWGHFLQPEDELSPGYNRTLSPLGEMLTHKTYMPVYIYNNITYKTSYAKCRLFKQPQGRQSRSLESEDTLIRKLGSGNKSIPAEGEIEEMHSESASLQVKTANEAFFKYMNGLKKDKEVKCIFV